MPPYIPRKRFRTPTPEKEPSKSNDKAKAVGSVTQRKPTLFDALDASTSSKQTVQKTKNLLANLAGSDDDSDLTLLSSSEPDFEDVPAPKRQRIENIRLSDEEEDDIEFEDVQSHAPPRTLAPQPSGDLDLTLTKETRISLVNPHNKKQGPSKIERQIRVSTHCMHVQFLLWHNWIRNQWINDEEVQQTLIKQLGPNIQERIERWRVASGLAPAKVPGESPKSRSRGKKGKGVDARSRRDWGEQAERLATGTIDMSQGDPLFSLMKDLSAYWRKRFRITAPGLRKLGYMSLVVLDEELKSFSKDPHDTERHGERIRNIEEFRVRANLCEGSRDLSAILFCALLRALGLETRIIVSLQAVGFGWSKNEDAVEQTKKSRDTIKGNDDSTDSEKDEEKNNHERKGSTTKNQAEPTPKRITKADFKKSARRSSRGSGLKDAPIDVSDSELLPDADDTDNESSVIDVTPIDPRKRPSKLYEKDLPPNYWVEVLSPVTKTYYAVNSLNASNPVATNPELLESLFSPRGAKSEKHKQVLAYVVGYSPCGAAKDVTVRYLKRHMWPGKTKGFRMPIEKVPIYNHHGKIKRYEEFDWFKTVMSRYERSSNSRTEVDDLEEATDLKAVKPEKKVVKEGEETLQSYKSSAEFVLERHLRREEALLPTAKHVKLFTVKGKKGEPETEEKVFLRSDVSKVKSVETWHKEGRIPKVGEQPMKRVPYRAATTNRKRELAEAEAASGEKMLQGLYSWDQTDWIIPPPIVDGIIPKNGYGNIDAFTPTMIPVGAVHIPQRRTKEICKRLGIDYAEAVTGFEFGARMAIPVITGVVIAEENEDIVLQEWEKDEAERARKEDLKRTNTCLGNWRKFLMGLRIVERMREEYGDEVDDSVDVLNPWINKKSKLKTTEEIEEEIRKRMMDKHGEDMAGGFFPEEHKEEEPPQSFFPTRHDDDYGDDDGGGFIVESAGRAESQHSAENAYATPISMPSNARSRLDATANEESESNPTNKGKKLGLSKTGQSSRTKFNTQTKSKTASARKANANARTRAGSGKGKQPSFSDDEDAEQDEDSSPSSLESPLSAASPPPNFQKRRTIRPSVKSQTQPRAVPQRRAARKSETALKSHYFEHSDDEDGE